MRRHVGIPARGARALLSATLVGALAASACGDEVSRSDDEGVRIGADALDGATDLGGDLDDPDGSGDASSDVASDLGDVGTSDGSVDDVDEDPDAGEDAAAGDSGGDAAGADLAGLDLGGDAVQPGAIAIFLAGDETERVFDDGLVGQTPRDYVIALSRYELLRNASDEDPALCFDHGERLVAADMSGDTLMGRCSTESVPTGSYTHGRVKVEWVRLTIAGRVHSDLGVFPGDFEVFRAYSDTRYDGRTWRASQGYIEYQGVANFRVEVVFATDNDAPTHVIEDGEYLLTFPYGRTLPVVSGAEDAYWARFHWQTFEGFRWQERDTEGFREGEWDVVAETPTDSESVRYQGVTGYYVTTSLD